MNDYGLFLKLMDEELSEEELFYFCLKNKNIDNILICANNTKKLKKEYPSVVYKGQDVTYFSVRELLGHVFLNEDLFFNTIDKIIFKNEECRLFLKNKTIDCGILTTKLYSSYSSIGFTEKEDAEKYKNILLKQGTKI